MSVISEAIQSILADRDIKQALVDYIRADIKPVQAEWREVWRQKGTESLHITVDRATDWPIDRPYRDVTLRIIALWHNGKQCGVINGYLASMDDHPALRYGDGYQFIHEAVAAENYTEVIEAAQEAWGRFWIELTSFVEKENLRLKAQVNL